MPKTKTLMASAGTADDVEAAFYDALQTGDLDKLMACWADEDDIVCVHPGGARLMGAAAIRASYESLFVRGPLPLRTERLHRVDTLGACVHSLLERVDLVTPQGQAQAYVLVTNVYHKTAQGWRLVAHHASPATPSDSAPAVGAVLH